MSQHRIHRILTPIKNFVINNTKLKSVTVHRKPYSSKSNQNIYKKTSQNLRKPPKSYNFMKRKNIKPKTEPINASNVK